MLRKSPLGPRGVPCPSPSSVPPVAARRRISLSAVRRAEVRRALKFKLVPRASLATVGELQEPGGRTAPAREGNPVDPRWIPGGSGAWREREAEGGARTHPRDWRGCRARGGQVGTPVAHCPQPLSSDMAPLQQDGCAGPWACLAASTEQLIV